jgi:hypothetical protein
MNCRSLTLLFFSFFLLTSQFCFSQVHNLLLQPGSSIGKDGMINSFKAKDWVASTYVITLPVS